MSDHLTVEEVAVRMGRPIQYVLGRLQALGINVQTRDDQVEPEEISALLVGKRPAPRLSIYEDTQTWYVGDEVRPIAPPKTAPLPPNGALAPTELSSADGELILTLRDLLVRNRQGATDEVFVVHGHDGVKHQISSFIAEVGLKPVMLDAQPNRGRTIIEKLEDHANTSFAVVLLTADDEGRKKGDEFLCLRARQNVILELGYFIARLGRHRVCALHSPGVELPSDIHGILYVPLDDTGAWKYALYSEMVAAGMPVKRHR